MPSIDVSRVGKRFGRTEALRGVTFRADRGMALVLGPNGAGKSTLLKCIDGLLRTDGGRVRVNGADPYADQSLHAKMALMTENYALYDHLTVADNLKFFGRLYGIPDREILAKGTRMLRGLSALKYLGAKVQTLSRGTKQKVAFCRAVINDPEVLLLDEPTAFLDATAADYLREFIVDQSRRGPVVFVTQRIDEVTRYDARLLVLREGRLIRDTATSSIYTEMFRDSFVNIRLARPIPASALRRIRGMSPVGAGERTATVRVSIDGYRDIDRAIRELLKRGAYITSVDYAEPMLERVFSRG
jgi:ABC-type multidrug transport system ATPase subunit